MTAILCIAQRELASFFRSSIGWIVTALFLVLAGAWFTLSTISPSEPATLRTFFGLSQWILLIIAPAISMRLISEELRTGTIEPLMTAPLSDWQIVIGKYVGALGFLLAMFVPTLLYVVLLEVLAEPDYGPIITGYLGLFLVGAMYVAGGLLASALTRNQVVALLGTFFAFLGIELGSTQGAQLLGPPFSEPLYALSTLLRLRDFAKGVIDTEHIIFFLAASVWLVAIAVVTLEMRRWR